MIILRKNETSEPVNRYGFQVVSDTIGVPSSVTLTMVKVTKGYNTSLCRVQIVVSVVRLFIRSAIAT